MSDKASRIKITPALIAGILVFIFFGIALYLRIALPYDRIFTDEWIKFNGTDSYYHMRIIDNLVFNFPHLNSIDPYMVYPGGMRIDSFPFYKYLLAGIIWLFSFGSPDDHIINCIGVYFPAVIGSLTVIPVYVIGKTIFNRWAGVFAAGLIAILPGEFLGRTVLGFADHHAVEVLFTTLMFMFLVLAIKTADQKDLNFQCFKQRQWSLILMPVVYSVFAGIFLGIYFNSWRGAPLFAFIIFIYFFIQFIVDHIMGKKTDYLCIIGFITFFVAFLVFLPFFIEIQYLAILLIAFLAIGVMGAISWFIANRSIAGFYYPLVLVVCAGIGAGVLYVIDAQLFNSLAGMFTRVTRSGASLTTLEAQPILFPGGTFSFSVAWANFTTGMFFSVISLGFIIHSLVKNQQADKIMLVVWSLVILVVTLTMRRFAYYYAVNVAILTGYAAWLMLYFIGFKERNMIVTEETHNKKKKDRRKRKQTASYGTPGRSLKIAGLIIVIVLVFYPNIGPLPRIGPFKAGTKPAIDTARHIPYIPDDAWCEACDWLRNNTPEPFGDPDYYYANYEDLVQMDDYTPPESTYSVAAWWDFGYWIVRMGHRVPTCNPGSSGRGITARIFTDQTEKAATKRANKLNTKFIVIDYDTVTVKFYALADYAGDEEEMYFEMYFQDGGEGLLRGDYYFYPEYYQSLAVRLYNFDGQSVIPGEITVISYDEKYFDGEPYKLITSKSTFLNYDAALQFIEMQPSDNYRIVGVDPFVSPIPLEPLEQYKVVFNSEDVEKKYSTGLISQVKIFEYVGMP